jgi:lipoyl synthase
VTSVTRDDLPDGGAAHFAATIGAVRARLPQATIEVLTPDFQGDEAAVATVLEARPDVFNHNIETVARLYATVRPQADYARSLAVLRYADDWQAAHGVGQASRLSPPPSALGKVRGTARDGGKAGTGETPVLLPLPTVHTKSGLMVGLGETEDEVRAVMRDLRTAGVEILTIGQYLAPSGSHLPVARFVEPEEFERWRVEGLATGFRAVAAGPFVRSSYQAGEVFGSMNPDFPSGS